MDLGRTFAPSFCPFHFRIHLLLYAPSLPCLTVPSQRTIQVTRVLSPQLHREPKMLDESWQSRQGVEATVLTTITGIGADS